MRREWSAEELIGGWTLIEEDGRLLGNKSGTTRLGFGMLLKYFELEGRFPRHAGDVPALPLATSPTRYDRAQIRKALGFRDATVRDKDKLAMLALHLLQAAPVHVNPLLVRRVLSEWAWLERFTDEDRRGLIALFWSNIRPYGLFELDMDRHLDFDLAATA